MPNYPRFPRAAARAFALFLLLATISVGVASAATFTVTKTDDTNDGVCDSDCSVTEAAEAANATLGADTILVPEGVYTPSLLVINDDAEIVGSGPDTTIINGGPGGDHVIRLTSVANLKLSGLTLQNSGLGDGLYVDTIVSSPLSSIVEVDNCIIRDNSRAGIQLDSHSSHHELTLVNSVVSGNPRLGVYNRGVMRIVGSSIRDNIRAGYVVGSFGGGIQNEHTLVIENSSITGNVTERRLVAYQNGGGIADRVVFETPVLTIINSTISGNTVQAYGGYGGGIYNREGEVTVINSTIANNTGSELSSSGSASYNELAATGTIRPVNSLIDGTCVGLGLQSNGGNLETPGATCGLTDSTDQVNVVDPLIGPLADNGGLPLTHALLEDSPAIDAGNQVDCPPVDQRRAPRDSSCDIGSFEFGATPPNPTDPQVLAVTPNRGGDTGVVTLTVSGTGFEPDTDVILSGGGPDITPRAVTVDSSGITMFATFDLRSLIDIPRQGPTLRRQVGLERGIVFPELSPNLVSIDAIVVS